MKKGGALVYSMEKIFAQIGYKPVVHYVSWNRTRIMAEKGEIDCYAPTIRNDLLPGFTFFKTSSKVPWVIIQRKEKPIEWHKLSDLYKYEVGRVLGYYLRDEERQIYTHGVKVQSTTDNSKNLLMVATGRIDYAVIDPIVFSFLMQTDPSLIPYKDKLEINKQPLSLSDYGIAIRDSKKFVGLKDLLQKPETIEKLNRYVIEYLTNKDYIQNFILPGS
nr:transporter substrate-binding domain-containing protein [Bdellovibrio sp. ArHS]